MVCGVVGTLVNRDAYATTGIDLNAEKQGIADTVGLLVRVKGDGQTYGVSLTSGASLPSQWTRSGIQTISVESCHPLQFLVAIFLADIAAPLITNAVFPPVSWYLYQLKPETVRRL